MTPIAITSQITFLYYDDLAAARDFFDNVLKLRVVYDPKWSCVWETGPKTYIGAVDKNKGAITVEETGGVLISMTVRDIENIYAGFQKEFPQYLLTGMRTVEDIGLKSFLLEGPEGYKFEIQEFMNYELKNLF